MDIMDIIKNPVIIGLLAGMLTYMYMKWRNDSGAKKHKNKKSKDINLLIPLAVFIVFWFISYAYFSSNDDDTLHKHSSKHIEPELPKKYKLTRDIIDVKIDGPKLSDTSEPASFNLVSNGVHIPNQLPDIMFEMF